MKSEASKSKIGWIGEYIYIFFSIRVGWVEQHILFFSFSLYQSVCATGCSYCILRKCRNTETKTFWVKSKSCYCFDSGLTFLAVCWSSLGESCWTVHYRYTHWILKKRENAFTVTCRLPFTLLVVIAFRSIKQWVFVYRRKNISITSLGRSSKIILKNRKESVRHFHQPILRYLFEGLILESAPGHLLLHHQSVY